MSQSQLNQILRGYEHVRTSSIEVFYYPRESNCASLQVAEAETQKAVKEVHDINKTEEDKIADVAVSYHRTWARRGFQSLYGMFSAISVQTGKVVDTEMKTKVCHKRCAKSNLDENSQEYIDWIAQGSYSLKFLNSMTFHDLSEFSMAKVNPLFHDSIKQSLIYVFSSITKHKMCACVYFY